MNIRIIPNKALLEKIDSLIENINKLCLLIPEWNKIEMEEIREKIIKDIQGLYKLDNS